MRHTFILILISFLSSNISTAQNTEIAKRKFLIGLSFEPNIAYRQLNYTQPNSWVEDLRNEKELPKFGFSTGINLRYKVNPKFSFDGAIIFANRGMTTKKIDLEWVSPNAEYLTKSKTTYSYYYIEIPIKGNYHFKVGKLKAYVTGGVSLNNFTNRVTKTITYTENGKSNSEKAAVNYGFVPNTYSAILGLGIDIPFKNRWLLNFEPLYRQNFTSISYERNGKEYFFSVGANVKLFYQFQRKGS
jgi:hypothetical protein